MANLLDRVTIDPEVCGGRPCIRGMRVRVKDILEMLAGGATRGEILADFPTCRMRTSPPRSKSAPARPTIRSWWPSTR